MICSFAWNTATTNSVCEKYLSPGPLHDPLTWYGINYAGTQIAQRDFQNKGKSGWTGTSFFVLKVSLRYLRISVIYSVPCDLQRAHWRISVQCQVNSVDVLAQRAQYYYPTDGKKACRYGVHRKCRYFC